MGSSDAAALAAIVVVVLVLAYVLYQSQKTPQDVPSALLYSRPSGLSPSTWAADPLSPSSPPPAGVVPPFGYLPGGGGKLPNCTLSGGYWWCPNSVPTDQNGTPLPPQGTAQKGAGGGGSQVLCQTACQAAGPCQGYSYKSSDGSGCQYWNTLAPGAPAYVKYSEGRVYWQNAAPPVSQVPPFPLYVGPDGVLYPNCAKGGPFQGAQGWQCRGGFPSVGGGTNWGSPDGVNNAATSGVDCLAACLDDPNNASGACEAVATNPEKKTKGCRYWYPGGDVTLPPGVVYNSGWTTWRL